MLDLKHEPMQTQRRLDGLHQYSVHEHKSKHTIHHLSQRTQYPASGHVR